MPAQQPNTGSVQVIGTITVDALGSLTASDFVSYSLAFTGTNNTTTLTESNSTVYLTSGYFIASASSLTENLPSMNVSGSVFAIYDSSPNQQTSLALSGGNGSPDNLHLGTTGGGGNRALGTDGVAFLVGTTSVPEPSSLILTGVGVLLTLNYARSRRQRARAA